MVMAAECSKNFAAEYSKMKEGSQKNGEAP